MPARSAHRQSASRRPQAPVKVSIWYRLKRGLLQGTVLLGVLAVLAGAAQGGLYLMQLQVERIAITGTAAQVAVEDIQALVGPQLEIGFLAADLDDIREQLEAMPWVYDANVRRRWPDAVVIQIEEQRPIARWGSDGFLNHEGEYFPGAMDSRWEHLARLEGPAGSEAAMMQRYKNLEALLSESGLEVVWLGEDEVGQVSAELDSGILLSLGSQHFVQRVRRFVRLSQDFLQDQQVLSVDLRYEHGAAVRLLTEQFALNTPMTSQSKEDSL